MQVCWFLEEKDKCECVTIIFFLFLLLGGLNWIAVCV